MRDMKESHCSTISVDLYRGNLGKREAVLRFLQRALSLERPTRLLLTSQEDMTWLSGDRDFLETWKALLHQVIESGHKIVIIHSFDRSLSSLLFIMDYWLPMHLTGQLDGYCYSDFAFDRSKTTLFILEEQACIFSRTYEGAEHQQAFYFTQKDVIRMFEESFWAKIRSCRPLMKRLPSAPMERMQEIAAFEKKNCACVAFAQTMSAWTMPVHIYEKVLGRLDIDPIELKRRSNFHRKRQADFIRAIKEQRYSLLYHIDRLEEIVHRGGVTYGGGEFFESENIIVPSADFVEHLIYISDLLEMNPLLEVSLVCRENTALKMKDYGYILKEGDQVILTPGRRQRSTSVYVASDEPTVMRAVSLCHQYLQQSVSPEDRDVKTMALIFRQAATTAPLDPSSCFYGLLTEREYEIALMIAEGLTSREIAEKTFISLNTVKSHIKNIYRKIGVSTKVELTKLISSKKESV
ncbi:two-component transcriptional response regulator, putative [Heliomicrobium modesticaldum Ice1]|uniref:Two-component transcriptional response regulator, putative n=2 Tax=Heliomicrobium modesticaldum TaxID=35701 RepID=B0TB43_HELMI|nr:two-component transcriptional response regulator, putative [Heliomicrobium modesticaldum Ice1]